MDQILRVQDLITELEKLPMGAPVMIAVVKYPDQFELKVSSDGEATWDHNEAVEVVPLETGEIHRHGDLIYITAELTDYAEEANALSMG